jgi:hypothetical protein
MGAIDWEAYEEKARKMTVAALARAVWDCREAEKAMRGWNPDREGFYSDQASIYSRELRTREAKDCTRFLEYFRASVVMAATSRLEGNIESAKRRDQLCESYYRQASEYGFQETDLQELESLHRDLTATLWLNSKYKA